MIFLGEGFVQANAVKRTVRTKFFAKRNMHIKEARLFIGTGRQVRQDTVFKIQGAGKLFPGCLGNYLINHNSFPIFHLIHNHGLYV